MPLSPRAESRGLGWLGVFSPTTCGQPLPRPFGFAQRDTQQPPLRRSESDSLTSCQRDIPRWTRLRPESVVCHKLSGQGVGAREPAQDVARYAGHVVVVVVVREAAAP